MNNLLSKMKAMSDTDVLKDLVKFIKDNKKVSKKQIMEKLGWGRGIKWTPYRRGLMNHPNIFDTINENPEYNWKENISNVC